MYRFRSFLIAALLAIAPIDASIALTAQPVVPGYDTVTGCLSTATTPCFVPGVPSVPLTGTGQYNVAPVASTALTVPASATYGVMCATTASVNYTYSGTTPTSTVGLTLSAGVCMNITSHLLLTSFLGISATGTFSVEYFK